MELVLNVARRHPDWRRAVDVAHEVVHLGRLGDLRPPRGLASHSASCACVLTDGYVPPSHGDGDAPEGLGLVAVYPALDVEESREGYDSKAAFVRHLRSTRESPRKP